jgi:hypothetical protein
VVCATQRSKRADLPVSQHTNGLKTAASSSNNPIIRFARAHLPFQTQNSSVNFLRLGASFDAPVFSEQDGYFVVTFPGPNGNYERLKVPAGAVGLITPAIQAQLNERQKKIMVQVQQTGFVTSGWCRKNLDVVYDTIRRDLIALVQLGLVKSQGRGRNARYVLQTSRE